MRIGCRAIADSLIQVNRRDGIDPSLKRADAFNDFVYLNVELVPEAEVVRDSIKALYGVDLVYDVSVLKGDVRGRKNVGGEEDDDAR